MKRYDELEQRFSRAKAGYEKVTEDIRKKGIRKNQISRFIKELEEMPELFTDFDEALWGALWITARCIVKPTSGSP